MRKSLLTIALACAFPVAHAQSSVTLYGIVDVGIESLDVGSVDATRLQSGISAGSRWGIRGSEELKPGWRALFTLETGLRPTPGARPITVHSSGVAPMMRRRPHRPCVPVSPS